MSHISLADFNLVLFLAVDSLIVGKSKRINRYNIDESFSHQTTTINTIIDCQIENVNQVPEALDMRKYDKPLIQWDYILSMNQSFV